MKSNIDPIDKSNKISMDTHAFNESLINTMNDIRFNMKKITNIQKNHNELFNFLKTTNLYENYKWIKLTSDYKLFKQKINKDKKSIHTITKVLGSLTNYYDQTELDNINIEIKLIDTNTELMIYKFNILRIQHVEIYIKKSAMLKKNTVIIINEMNDANLQLLKKIYENYWGIKKLNINIDDLMYKKKHLKFEINDLKLIIWKHPTQTNPINQIQ